uniref:Uncharacterized protein n=1 Tax=Panagrolaimus sp. ES5 TaxID=591445 RepID=A0AC34GIV5_9BILA
MKEEIVKAEKVVRYLIEIRLIRVFNIEDDIKQYFNDINKYKWRQGAMFECHMAAIKFLNQILLADEFLYFSYFKWVVIWLKLKQI